MLGQYVSLCRVHTLKRSQVLQLFPGDFHFFIMFIPTMFFIIVGFWLELLNLIRVLNSAMNIVNNFNKPTLVCSILIYCHHCPHHSHCHSHHHYCNHHCYHHCDLHCHHSHYHQNHYHYFKFISGAMWDVVPHIVFVTLPILIFLDRTKSANFKWPYGLDCPKGHSPP